MLNVTFSELVSAINDKLDDTIAAIPDVTDVLDSTSTVDAASANTVRRLYNMIGSAVENGQNLGAFATYAALIAAYPTPPAGSYAYVQADETHDGHTWRYDQAVDPEDGESFIWSATIMVNDVPRDFEQEPITTDELTDGSVTGAKLAAAINTLIASKAPLASPALTGAPTGPTAAPGTNTTQLATTAYARLQELYSKAADTAIWSGNVTFVGNVLYWNDAIQIMADPSIAAGGRMYLTMPTSGTTAALNGGTARAWSTSGITLNNGDILVFRHTTGTVSSGSWYVTTAATLVSNGLLPNDIIVAVCIGTRLALLNGGMINPTTRLNWGVVTDDLKANLASPALTGTPTINGGTVIWRRPGDNTGQLLDLDTLTDDGWWEIRNASNAKDNLPKFTGKAADQNFFLEVRRRNSVYTCQTAWDVRTTAVEVRRQNNGTWSAWQPLYDTCVRDTVSGYYTLRNLPPKYVAANTGTVMCITLPAIVANANIQFNLQGWFGTTNYSLVDIHFASRLYNSHASLPGAQPAIWSSGGAIETAKLIWDGTNHKLLLTWVNNSAFPGAMLQIKEATSNGNLTDQHDNFIIEYLPTEPTYIFATSIPINNNFRATGAKLLGTPTAPTAPLGTNTQQIATTAFVNTAIDSALVRGAWTPTIKGSITDPVVEGTTYGVWHRVGRHVTLDARIDVKINTIGAGNIHIGGLPFTPSIATLPETGGIVSYSNGFTYPAGILYYKTSNTLVVVRNPSQNGQITCQWDQDFLNTALNFRLLFQIAFFID